MKIDRKVILVLAALVFIRIITTEFPSDSNFPLDSDHQTYLHIIQMIKDHGFVKWDEYWYGGMPFQTNYPMLSFTLAAILPFGDLFSYELLRLFFWAVAPIAAYFAFKEILSKKEALVATSIFSLSTIFAVRFSLAQTPAFVAIPFALLFLTYFFRMVKEGRKLDVSLAAVFLSATILSHHFIAILAGVISLTYAVSKRKDLNVRHVVYCYSAGGLMALFWLVPYILSLPYVSINTGELLTLAARVKSFHNLFGYYLNYTAIVASLLALLLGILYFYKRKVRWDNFEVLSLAVMMALNLLPFSIINYRGLVFIIFPIAIMFAKLYEKHRKLILSLILLQGILFVSYLYPPATQNLSEEMQVAQFLSGEGGRTLIIPAQTSFMGYTLPKYGVHMAAGSYSVGLSRERANFLENTLGLNVNCARGLSLSEVIQRMDLLSKGAAIENSACTFDTLNTSGYTRAGVNHVIVDNNYPAIESMFSASPEFMQEFRNGRFTVYQYLKENSTISMSWYPYWKADGYVLGKDEYGFMTFSGSGPINLVYEEPQFYGWLGLVSLAALVLTVYYARPTRKD